MLVDVLCVAHSRLRIGCNKPSFGAISFAVWRFQLRNACTHLCDRFDTDSCHLHLLLRFATAANVSFLAIKSFLRRSDNKFLQPLADIRRILIMAGFMGHLAYCDFSVGYYNATLQRNVNNSQNPPFLLLATSCFSVCSRKLFPHRLQTNVHFSLAV